MHSINQITCLALQLTNSFTCFGFNNCDNLTQMKSPVNPPWKEQLKEELSRQPVNFFTFATVKDGKPRARTLTLKGFLGETGAEMPTTFSDSLFVGADSRQDKVQEVLASPAFEAVFWLPNVGSQWRIRGEAAVLGGDDAVAREKITQHLQPAEGWTFEDEILKGFNTLDKGQKYKFGVTDGGVVGVVPKEFRMLVLLPQVVERLGIKPPELGIKHYEARIGYPVGWVES
ncbi:hypothetical protein L873DRAFT_385325 [Choiromyces venosus 120613-1]|uniref:Pyridoxamine 5'-phosphate oxidase Alr4036 family FMN-binding domain-containing protein n=1 Tax=Choiromyces venosus 120613-1 TaxID=1336337 RepID=A0A3N4JAA3_9PEZI|nr:hypothetical protein L873DRAFT_385325 [Choiromyces venosus 120613-1]